MMTDLRRWVFAAWGACLLLALVLAAAWPALAPLGIMASLAAAIPSCVRAWGAVQGTALRGAVVWAAAALFLAIASQAVACVEPVELGRPGTGRLVYLMVLTILAALISVLGARNPGGGAWAILMALLVLVFLIPWLELSGKVRRGPAQVQLDSPWTLFYALLVLAGVTNYLPTRYGPAALALGAGLAAEYLGLTRTGWTPRGRAAIWSLVAWSLSLSGWLAVWRAGQADRGREPLDRLWFWFRDHWGVVWALRTQERFNRTAEAAGWPLRLSWFGTVALASGGQAEPAERSDAATATLRNLLRRFATPARVEEVLRSATSDSCHAGAGEK